MNLSKIKRNSFCRLCLKKHHHLMDIFEDSDEEENDISKYINLFFAVEITKSDHFSTRVCKPCWDIIVCTCKSRIEFRNNDVLLQNYDNETPFPIKLQEPVRTRQHKSVTNILQKYSGIILEPDLWHLNFNAAVNLSKCRVPLDSPYLLQLYQTSELLEESSPKLESPYLPQQPNTSKDLGELSPYLPQQPQTCKNLENPIPRLNSPYLSQQPQTSTHFEKPSRLDSSYLPQQSQTYKYAPKPSPRLDSPYLPQQSQTSKHLEEPSRLDSSYSSQQPQSSKQLEDSSPKLGSPYLYQLLQTPKHLKKPSHRISRYDEDPDFELRNFKSSETRYSHRSKNKLNYSESGTEFTNNEDAKLSDSEITRRNKRNAKRPRIFGSPLYIPDNELDDIALDYYGV